MKNVLLSVLAAGSIVAGCATTETSTEPRAERVREYTTGSNIPRRSNAPQIGVEVYDREAFERARDRMPQGLKGGPGGSPP
jgi:hypothetical protein